MNKKGKSFKKLNYFKKLRGGNNHNHNNDTPILMSNQLDRLKGLAQHGHSQVQTQSQLQFGGQTQIPHQAQTQPQSQTHFGGQPMSMSAGMPPLPPLPSMSASMPSLPSLPSLNEMADRIKKLEPPPWSVIRIPIYIMNIFGFIGFIIKLIIIGFIVYIVGMFCVIINFSLIAFHKAMKPLGKINLDMEDDIKKTIKNIPKGFKWLGGILKPIGKIKINIGDEITKGVKDVPKDFFELMTKTFAPSSFM
jgi:hypothetical protein